MAKYLPAIKDAQVVKRMEAGQYQLVLLTNVQSIGPIKYAHLLVVYPAGTTEPCFVVSSEVNNLASPEGPTHFLCTFPGEGHCNYGCSNEWANLASFEKAAKEILSRELSITID
ncbi:MAG TPA: hypothetical protein PLI09_24945 [Candidatus Hydrogenedentes bacterium]|nr:hypothetical protein [Candidatus Hydrogenedentota bacterium]